MVYETQLGAVTIHTSCVPYNKGDLIVYKDKNVTLYGSQDTKVQSVYRVDNTLSVTYNYPGKTYANRHERRKALAKLSRR